MLSDRSQVRIIVVDDDDLMLRMLAPRLASPGGEVVTASTPSQALERLPDADRPVAVVSDFNLRSDMNGTQLLEAVARTHPHATRVLMSGYSAEQIGLQTSSAIHAFVEKGLRLDDTVEPILQALRARHPQLAHGPPMT